MDPELQGKYSHQNNRRSSINERSSMDGSGLEQIVVNQKITPRNNVHSLISNYQIKNDQSEDYIELLGINKDSSVMSSNQNFQQEKNIEEMKQKFQK